MRKSTTKRRAPPEKKRKKEPLEQSIEDALELGHFIDYRKTWDFVDDLEEVSEEIDKLIDAGKPERGVSLYETFIAGCYEKAEEIDDSGGTFSMFVEGLFCGWIKARQSSREDPKETAEILLSWMDNDPYGFCYQIERRALESFNKATLSAFEELMLRRLSSSAGKEAGDREGPGGSPSYRRPRAAELLKEIYAVKRDADAYISICNQTELTPKDCEVVAGIHRRRGRLADALAWVEKGISLEDEPPMESVSGHQLCGMKRELLRKLGRGDEALESAWLAFERHPDVYTYDELMKYVPRARRLEWHRKAMDAAESGPLDSLIKLCVKHKELDRLADYIRRASNEHLEKISHYTTEPAAEKIARTHPDLAAKLYRTLGMRILVAKKSKYYDAALRHFERAKRCYVKAGTEDRWDALVAEVQEKHGRKYGFMPGFERVVSGKRAPSDPSFAERTRRRWKRRGRP